MIFPRKGTFFSRRKDIGFSESFEVASKNRAFRVLHLVTFSIRDDTVNSRKRDPKNRRVFIRREREKEREEGSRFCIIPAKRRRDVRPTFRSQDKI